MATLQLQPIDTFFFKDHQATETGANSFMQGIFPPRPSTIYGSLRSAYIHANESFEAYAQGTDGDVKKWMGTPEQLGEFAIQYVSLFHNEQELLPLPLDYQAYEKDGTLIAAPLTLTEDTAPSSAASPWRLQSSLTEKTKGASNVFVTKEAWKQALLHTQAIDTLTPLSQLLVPEQKLGIALEHTTRTTKDQHLYQLTKLRFKERGGFNVYTTSSPSFAQIEFTKVGGENRPWTISEQKQSFSLWNEQELKTLRETIARTNIVKFVLLSPAIWQNGAKPASFADGRFTVGGATFEWLTGAIGRPSIYGGWDMVQNRPKSRAYMIPEGSVVYAKLCDGTSIDDVLALANGCHFTDEGQQQGFGFAILAAVQ